MLNHTNPGKPDDQQSQRPYDRHPMPPNMHDSTPLGSPHFRASKIHLNYDDPTVERLSEIYADVEYVVHIIETCPPEIKLTLAMLLGIQVDLSDYPHEAHQMIRFEIPFLDDKNSRLIEKVLECDQGDAAVSIYNHCPPEQALLALTVAALKTAKTGDDA